MDKEPPTPFTDDDPPRMDTIPPAVPMLGRADMVIEPDPEISPFPPNISTSPPNPP